MRLNLESGSTLCSHLANISTGTSTASAMSGLIATAINHGSKLIQAL